MSRAEAEMLARVLDGDVTVNGEASDELRSLATLATAMKASSAQPRPEFRDELRSRLVDEARTQAHAPTVLSRFRQRIDATTARWRYSTRAAAASGAAALALSTGGVAVAAVQSLPGDLLYPVKLAMSDAGTALERDPVAKGDRELAAAVERLQEAHGVTRLGEHEAAANALRAADTSARSGAGWLIRAWETSGDADLTARLAAFSNEQRASLMSLSPLLDGEAVIAATEALVSLDRIDARVAALIEGCPPCPEDATPASGAAFDFSDIPPASEPFEACPCEPTDDTANTGALPDSSPETERDYDAIPHVDDAEPAPSPSPQAPTVSESGSGAEESSGTPGAGADEAGQETGERVRRPVDDSRGVVDDLLDSVAPEPTPSGDSDGDEPTDDLRDTIEDVEEDLRDTTDGVLP